MLNKIRCVIPAASRGHLLTSSVLVQKLIDINTKGQKTGQPCDFKLKPRNKLGYNIGCKAVSSPGCVKALVDMPICEDPTNRPACRKKCAQGGQKKKPKYTFMKYLKLKCMPGGTNFGTPVNKLECDKLQTFCPPPEPPLPKFTVAVPPPMPPKRDAIQVAILGAETNLGQNIAMLLKQCSCVKMLRLYEAEYGANRCDRDMFRAAEDLLHIDTNCEIEAYTSKCNDLERALQGNEIVLILGSSTVKACVPYHKRFQKSCLQMVKYAEGIAKVCPRAFIVVCATPVEMNTVLISEIMKLNGWYDPTKLFGSVAVSEMRASTLAARSLTLLPCYTRVPCVFGTEGGSLLPLFSRAIEEFEWSNHHLYSLMKAVRNAPLAVGRDTGCGYREAELSEAHAIANLISKMAHAILCHDRPRFFSFVDTSDSIDVSVTKFMSCEIQLNGYGIMKVHGIPKMNRYETRVADYALHYLTEKLSVTEDWFSRWLSSSSAHSKAIARTEFFVPRHLDYVHDCAYSNLC